jgi:hypothetical protein
MSAAQQRGRDATAREEASLNLQPAAAAAATPNFEDTFQPSPASLLRCNNADRRQIDGEGYVVSREIDNKLVLILKRLNKPFSPPAPTIEHDFMDQACDGEGEEPANFECTYDGLDIEEEKEVSVTVEEDAAMHNQLLQQKRMEQMERRKTTHGFLCGFHHGGIIPLPVSWVYPKRMNLIQMITLWVMMGSPSERVPSLKLLGLGAVCHFDSGGNNLSHMKRVIKAVKHFAILQEVWKPSDAGNNYWNGGATVTKLWDGVWDDKSPYLFTRTELEGKPVSYHKSRANSVTWKTCHDKMMARGGLFEQLEL